MHYRLLLGVFLLEVASLVPSVARQKTKDLSSPAARIDVTTDRTLQAQRRKKGEAPKATCEQVCNAIWNSDLVAGSREQVLECQKRLCEQATQGKIILSSSIVLNSSEENTTGERSTLALEAETDRVVKMLHEQCLMEGVSVQTLSRVGCLAVI